MSSFTSPGRAPLPADILKFARIKGGCRTGKFSYLTQERAEIAAKDMNRWIDAPKWRGPRTPLDTYQCEHCGGWHAGRRRG